MRLDRASELDRIARRYETDWDFKRGVANAQYIADQLREIATRIRSKHAELLAHR